MSYFKIPSKLTIFVDTSDKDRMIFDNFIFYFGFGKDKKHIEWTASQICVVCSHNHICIRSVVDRGSRKHRDPLG